MDTELGKVRDNASIEQRDFSFHAPESLPLQMHPLIQMEILSSEACFSKNLEAFLPFPLLFPLTLKLLASYCSSFSHRHQSEQVQVGDSWARICKKKKSPLRLPKPMPFPQQQRSRIDGLKGNLREQNVCRELPAAAASELLCPVTRNHRTWAKHRERRARDPRQSKAQPLARSYTTTTSSELRVGKKSHSLWTSKHCSLYASCHGICTAINSLVLS